jgi:diguanylate cyclase (GGDEF)-like protein
VTRRFTQDDQNRRELEVLHRLAVELPRTLTVSGVTDLLAEHLVLATQRAGECTISSWDAARDQLTIMSCYQLDSGIDEAQRGELFTLDDWPHSRALLAEGSAHGEYRRDDPAWNQRVCDQLNEWGWQTWIDIAFCQTIASQAALAVRSAQLHEGMRQQVLHDQLTGLLSHRGLHEQLEACLLAANAGGGELSVVAFDLDGFRAVNDRDGHAAGDLVLRRVADVLREESRDCDIAARIGGDEFMLVLPGVSGDGPAIADRVLGRMAERTGVSLSAGVAQAQPGDLDARVLIGRAQSALRESRRSRPDRRRSA